MADVLDTEEEVLTVEAFSEFEDEYELDQLSAEFVESLVDKIIEFTHVLVGHPLHPYQLPFARRVIQSVLVNDGDLITAQAARQCLDGDTVVFRRDGTAVRLRHHEDAWSTGVKPTKRYRIRGGAEIIATDNHPVMTDRGWVPAGQLSVGDRVATLTEWDQWGTAEASQEHARFLGYMITDGAGTWKDGKGQSPKFTNTRDAYLGEVELLAKELFGVSARWYSKGSGFDLLLTGPRLGQRRNPVVAWLCEQGIDHGFPTQVFSWSREAVGAFVNRAWAGDGSLCVKMSSGQPQAEVFLACGNDEVYARYWQMLLAKAGVTSTIKREALPRGTGTFHRLVLGCACENILRFFDLVGDVFGKEQQSSAARLALSEQRLRNVDRAAVPCSGYMRHSYTSPPRSGQHTATCRRCGAENPKVARGAARAQQRVVNMTGIDGEKFTFQRVVAIEDAGEREVFDVEYPDKGWFVANRTYVHNSGKTETIADITASLMILLPRLAKIYPDLLDRFKDGFWVGMFAPVETQAETLFGRTVSRLTSERAVEILGDPEIDDITKRSPGVTRGIMLKKSGSTMLMMTANPRAKIESKTFHLIILDEAQEMEDFVVAKCFAEDTPLWLPDGSTRTVKEVVKQQLPVLSYDKAWDLVQRGGGRSRFNRANPVDAEIGSLTGTTPVAWFDSGVQDVWRVLTASGRVLETTAQHRWVVRERRGNSRPHWCETQHLTVGMNTPLPTGAPFWGTRLAWDEGYFVGQMLGDGCLSAGSPMWCGMDDPSLELMTSVAQSYGVSTRVNNVQESGLHEVAFTKPGNAKNPLMAFLEAEGLRGLKGDSKALMRDDYSEQFYLGWVTGLIDADGSVSGKTVVFSNISERLVRQLSDVLVKLGVPNGVQVRKNNGGFGADPKDLWEVRIRSREGVLRLAELIAPLVPHKAAALTKAVEFHSTRAGRTSRHLEGVHWDRIIEITYVGRKQTYCVTVEPSNLLIANGIVSGNSIEPMLAYTAGTMVKTGTPGRVKNHFYKSIQLNKRIASGRRGKVNHFQWDWRDVVKVNKNYEKFIKKVMLRIGEESEEFQLSYCCKWLLDRGMFITQTVFDNLGDTSMQTVKAWHQTPVVVGIDPARKTDSTVVTVVWVDWDRPDEFGYFDHRILNWLELQGDDWEEQYYQIVNFLAAYDVLGVAVDSNGVGDAVAQRLSLLLPRAEVVAMTSSQAEQSRRYKHLQALIQRELISWPAHAKTRRLKSYTRFMTQMLDAEKKYSGQFFTVEAPQETGAHDDYVDSLGLACSLTLDLTMPTVEQSSSPFFD